MPTKQEKLDRIYEVIAEKTLSTGLFGEDLTKQKFMILEFCPEYYRVLYLLGGTNNIANVNKEVVTIIGHPVMIGDVLERVMKNYNESGDIVDSVVRCRDSLRLPIEDQLNDNVDFIYSLLPQDDNL